MSEGLIYELIPKVMSEIGFVEKTRTNEIQKYKFRGIEDLYFAAHPAMTKHGIFCCPQVLDIQTQDRLSSNGKSSIHVIMKIAHKFYASDGSLVEVITCGEGMDSSDKAVAKCMSMAMKYALIELFCVPTADVEDADQSSPEAGMARGPVAPAITLTRPAAPAKLPEGNGHVASSLVSGSGPGEAGGSVDESPASSAPIPVEESPYISPKQRQYLARRFRESLRQEMEPRADELRHQALFAMQESGLFSSQFLDAGGNPTSDFVLLHEYESVGRALVKAAKSL